MNIHLLTTLLQLERNFVDLKYAAATVEVGLQRRDDVLWLEFQLPKGSFATTVLRELVHY